MIEVVGLVGGGEGNAAQTHHGERRCSHSGAAQQIQTAGSRLPPGVLTAKGRTLMAAMLLVCPHRTCCQTGLPCCASHCEAGGTARCVHVR